MHRPTQAAIARIQPIIAVPRSQRQRRCPRTRHCGVGRLCDLIFVPEGRALRRLNPHTRAIYRPYPPPLLVGSYEITLEGYSCHNCPDIALERIVAGDLATTEIAHHAGNGIGADRAGLLLQVLQRIEEH